MTAAPGSPPAADATPDDVVLLVAHGTVDSLDDLPEFLTNIRRGHAPSPELLAEVRRRYEAIGGASPLNAINRELAQKLSARLGTPVGFANRLFRPYPEDVLRELAIAHPRENAKTPMCVTLVPLAQHSAHVYGEAAKASAAKAGLDVAIRAATNWGQSHELVDAFARAIVSTLEGAPSLRPDNAVLLMTAHSLPVSVIEAGDPYEKELRASAEAVAARVKTLAPSLAIPHEVAFQSQGMSTGPGGRPMAWLGPDLRSTFEKVARAGISKIVVAPIGFLADHVEILYDLDIEARAWADELGIELLRVPSLNAGDAAVATLEAVVKRTREGG